MTFWDERLQQIRALREERTVRDRELYAIQLQMRKNQASLAKIRKQETVLPADPNRILDLKQQLAENTARLQQCNQELDALKALPEKIAATQARLAFLDQQLGSLSKQIDALNQTLAKQQQALRDEQTVVKRKKQLSILADTQNSLQQDQKKTAKALDALQQQASKTAQQREQLESTRTKLREKIATQTGKLQASLGAPASASDAATGASAISGEGYQEAKQRLQASRQAVDAAIGQLYIDVPPRDLVLNLNDDTPFLFVPVRVETRFMTTRQTPELWLRIYPDDIAVHTHEDVLTDREVTEGEKYWQTLWDATVAGRPDQENTKKAAWSGLVTQFGAERAAYVAAQTKPSNWERLGPEVNPVFPPHDLTKTSSWSRAPRTTVLPDKFVVMLYDGDTIVHEVVGAQVPDEVFVGPDPLEEDDAFVEKDDKLLFGEAFDWMSDFSKAVTLGLGFKIPITSQQAVNGFSKVLVMGLSLSASADETQQAVEALIDNHHYSPKGFSLVRQGTATNNTDDAGSGYTKNDPFNDISYFVETGAPLFTDSDDTDGRYLADALGIDYAPLQYVYNSDATDRREAIAMNTALYPATLGYYFDTLMKPVLSEAAQETLREFAVQRVCGRGSLPAIRVGNQPYGILLTSNFSQWQWSKQEYAYNLPFLQKLQEVIV